MTPSLSTAILKQQADDHLREIRKRKGVDGSDVEHDDNVRDLSRALDILSDQLYQKTTHFLLELIQNADDNTFDNDVVPTISILLDGPENARKMHINCNEVGFEKENIEALCRIGYSTKKIKDRTKGFIGEKGIGFKSVFKVANVVHISSKEYSFRLDRREILGMITPIIERFPLATAFTGGVGGLTREHQTQLLLEILGESEYFGICYELHSLKPQVLIFLRKIRKLIIRTRYKAVQFEIQSVSEDQDFDGKETATLTKTSLLLDVGDKKMESKYLIVRWIQNSLVKDDRRENVEETEIVLAFPVNNGKPLVQPQETYAYLPINDYGFSYLIQADFLLVANRESVDASKWNNEVLAGVYRAFVYRAVPRFNQLRGSSSHSLRYTWPLFLKDRGGTSEFWSKLKLWIFQQLGKEDVLESRQNGKLAHPTSLFYVPEDFRLNNEPLVEDGSSELHHLSFLYDSEIINTLPELKKMGVTEMEFSHFYQELKDLINKLGDQFLKSQSMKWHSKVARILCRHSNQYSVSNIRLIPLRDGRWVAPSQSHLFLEGKTTDLEVPGGLEICLVDHEACQDTDRMAFFRMAGIRKCDQAEVCWLIMQLYNPCRERSFKNSVQDLIYLFQTPRTVYNGPLTNLQAASFPNIRFMYATQLYIEYTDKKSIISKYTGDPTSAMPTLHPMYIEAARRLGKETEFVSWLCSELNMSFLPRLVDKQQFLLPEFHFLKAHAVEDLLLLLRDNWSHYASNLLSYNGKASRLKEAISAMMVYCINGISSRLDQTVLPREALKLAGPDLAFIKVPEPNDSRWLRFSNFGVLISLSTEFYLRELKALTARPVTSPFSKVAVEVIYSELGSCQDPLAVRKAFAERRLVYLHKLKQWTFLSECVWNGPQQLNSTHKLSTEYPLCSSLFQSYLLLGNATLAHVIKEFHSVTTITSFARLQQLLLLLNQCLLPKDLPGCLSELEGKKIIPVTMSGREDRMDFGKNGFYFADRQSLWERFNGKIPLIAFDVKTVRILNPLINAMQLSKYLLSVAVTQKLETVGIKIQDKERTDDLRKRAPYFVRLLTKETQETKARLLTRLTRLNVWGVQAIKLTLEVHDTKVTEDTNHIFFDDADDSKLEIYFSIKDSQKPIVDFELSKEFIRYCGIIDLSFQKLVFPIIQYPLEGIEKLLEEYELDEPSDYNEKSTELLKSVSEEWGEESAPIFQIINGTALPQRTPTSSTKILCQESSSQVSRPSSLLRDRIPELDQSIAFVREAAALPGTAPTLIITPFQTFSNVSPSLDSISRNTEIIQRSTDGSEILSTRTVMGGVKQGATTTTHHGAETSLDPFEFGNFHSEFSELFGLDSPSQKPRTPSTQHRSVPYYGRSPRTARMGPDPESTMHGLQKHKIGLLGETFINEWLSRHLGSDWDPTCHWTSRNRNAIYPDSPFEGSEKEYADFTYQDTNEDLTKLLTKFGFLRDVQVWSSNPPTYHLEVKSTSESCNEPFYMSNNQVNKARGWTLSWDNSIVPSDVYVVIRVYNLDKETRPCFTAYVDPWAMYLESKLEFLAREDYSVTPKNQVH